MQDQLVSHICNFVDGEVGVQSLSIAAQAEKVDRPTANRVLMLLRESGQCSTMALRERMRHLI